MSGFGYSKLVNYSQTLSNKVSNVSSSGSIIVSASITTAGNPVQVMVSGDAENSAAGGWIRIQLYRNSTAIGKSVWLESNGASENIPYALQVIDDVAAGTYTYSLKTITNASTGYFNFGEADGPALSVLEL